MNLEQTNDLRARASKHAALADPARLAIVDALCVADLSPSHLQTQIQMSSNLLAHHLKVLEEAEILTRSRSEGDRRRTYLKLVPNSLDGIMSRTGEPLPSLAASGARVVFVCTANTARSQLAAALWRCTSPMPVASAGTHPGDRIDPGAVAVARRHGVALHARRPRAVHEVVDANDFIVTVCDSAHEELSNPDVVHWSIPDPVPVGTPAAFDATFDQLSHRVGDLAQRVHPTT